MNLPPRAPGGPREGQHVDWPSVAEQARVSEGEWFLHPDLKGHGNVRSVRERVAQGKRPELRALGGRFETAIRDTSEVRVVNASGREVSRRHGDLWIKWTKED